MSLPFSSHIWVSGTRAPSPGRFAAWVPARVPRADQRRSGLARAQVTRAGPYMERLPAGRPLPTPRSCPAEGLGCGEGHRVRGVRQHACAPGCTCPPPPPCPDPGRWARTGPRGGAPHISPLLRVLCSDPRTSSAAPGRREPCSSGGPERTGGAVTPASRAGEAGDPSRQLPSEPGLYPTPSSPNPEG